MAPAGVSTPRAKGSEYMEWAKTRSQARFNLASSGVAELPTAELPFRLKDLELTGPSFYGYPPLQERLARKAGVELGFGLRNPRVAQLLPCFDDPPVNGHDTAVASLSFSDW